MTTTVGFEQARVAVERARRMAETWQQLQPGSGEIAAARARMVRAKVARRRGRLMPAIVAIAIMLAGAAAFAGVRTGFLRALLPRTTAVAPVVSALPPSPVAPKTLPPLTTAQPEEPPVVDPESLPLVVDPSPSGAARPAGTPSSATVAAPAAASASAAGGGWAAAAEALRSGDYGSADRAFGDLTASNDPRTRDEARLARAQVWVAQGRVVDARRELEQLASAGATPLVRARATDMLRSLRSGSPDRGSPGTNPP